MSTVISLRIRDGLESDIAACLALEADYETEHVWQMNVFEQDESWQISFRTEYLPRPMTVAYPKNERRLWEALPESQCFLVAANRETDEPLGYLTMYTQPAHRIAFIQDLVVTEVCRNRRIGTRLLKAARIWAEDHALERLIFETQTKNYPAINFCQQNGFVFSGYNERYYQNQDIAVFFSQLLR